MEDLMEEIIQYWNEAGDVSDREGPHEADGYITNR